MAVNRRSPRRALSSVGGFAELYPMPIIAQAAPTVNDLAEVGTIWIDQTGNDVYILLEVIAAAATWTPIGAGAGVFDSVTSTMFVTAGTTVTAGTGLIATTGGITCSDWTYGTVVSGVAGVLDSQALTNGEILIGSTGAAPVAATLTAGAGINIGNAAGAITITATGATAVQYTTDDANVVIPDGVGNINVVGGVNVGTTGAVANTITINVDNAPTFAGLVTCQVGLTQTAGTTTITSDTNGAQAIYLHCDGGVGETLELHSDQGTGAGAAGTASISVYSDVGGITLDAGIAAANAIRLYASDAAGGMDIDAGTGGIIADTTGAISLDSAAASNFTVTGAFDLTLDTTLGSVVIDGGEAAADAIQLTASNAAGGVTGAVGTGGYILGATNGPFTLTTGTGNIAIGTDAAAKNISIGNATGATAIDIDAGTGACTILSNATDHTVTFGSTTGTSAMTIQAGTGAMTLTAGGAVDVNATGNVTIDSTGGTLGLGEGADANNINIGTGAAARTITVGNATGATSFVLNAGTGNVLLASNGTVHDTTVGSAAGASATTLQAGTGALTLTAGGICDINGTGNITIDSTGGTIGLGEGADANNINIGTGAAARTITIGNGTGATSVVIDCGTGALDIGTNAVAHTVTVGSTTGAAATDIQAGTGGVTITSGGLIDPTPDTQTAASPAAAVTSNVNVGVATFTGFTTAAAATQGFTVNNSLVSATSGILVSIANLGGQDARMMIQRVTPGAGSFVVDTINNGTQACNGNILISFWVLN